MKGNSIVFEFNLYDFNEYNIFSFFSLDLSSCLLFYDLMNNCFIYYRSVAITGLILISLGTGGIKPCVYTFGGDQFQLPEQQDQLTNFFSRFITAIYIGSLISTFITPELRKSVECFGKDTCYPLAFGVLSLLMVSAIGN